MSLSYDGYYVKIYNTIKFTLLLDIWKLGMLVLDVSDFTYLLLVEYQEPEPRTMPAMV